MRHNSCLICNCTQLQELKDYKTHFLTRCKKCGFIFSSKIPTEEELNDYYSQNYSRQDYDSPITRKRYNELLDILERYRKTNNLLDIGCGIGYFLEEAKRRGWNVYGTEYTKEAIEICNDKGFKMQQGKLNPQNYKELTFDVITSFEVIEHINNPQEEIQNIKSILRDGGMFYFTTPNFNSFSRNLMKSEWSVICYPEHLSYYTPRTIYRFLKTSGFKKIKLVSTGISITRYKKTVNKDTQALISKQSDDEQIRQKVETKWHFALAKNSINRVLTTLGKGDTIKGFFIKN